MPGVPEEGEIGSVWVMEESFRDWEEEGVPVQRAVGTAPCSKLSRPPGKGLAAPGVPLAFQGSSVPSGV